MKIIVLIGLILLVIAFSMPKESEIYISNNPNSECVDFVSLVPASEIAKELGKSELWVLSNYMINLWEKPPSEGYRGKKVGEMISGSNARLIEWGKEGYLVISQKDKSRGWISEIQVKKVIKLNPKTFESCK